MDTSIKILLGFLVPPLVLLFWWLGRHFKPTSRQNRKQLALKGKEAIIAEEKARLAACKRSVDYFGLRGRAIGSEEVPSLKVAGLLFAGMPFSSPAGDALPLATAEAQPGDTNWDAGAAPAQRSKGAGAAGTGSSGTGSAGTGSAGHSPTVNRAIAYLEHISGAVLDDAAQLDEQSNWILGATYEFLSAELSRTDGDVNIDTVSEAVNRKEAKAVTFNYFFGAVYFIIVALILHSYMSSLTSELAETKDVYKEYSNLALSLPRMGRSTEYYRMATMLGQRWVRDTGKLVRSDSARVASDSSYANEYVRLDTSAATSLDSLRMKTARMAILANELRDRYSWICAEMERYPFGGGMTDAMLDDSTIMRGSIDPGQILLRGSKTIYVAEQMADNIKIFLLPMLYGLIGAYLWIIRRLSEQIKTFDFTWTKSIRNEARILFGLFVGMFFGYLFKPSDTGALHSLTPFLLAFIGGYHVEILFAAMDKVVEAFSNKQTPTRTHATAPGPKPEKEGGM